MAEIYPWLVAQQARVERWNEQDRRPHGILIYGPEGVGKQQFAERIASEMLLGSDAVNKSSQDFNEFVHPDWRRVAVPTDKKWIVIDQIRDLLHWLYLTSRTQGDANSGASSRASKVALIAPAERMNANAANALLKGLEEPPAGAVIILVSSRPAGLPATIRSRCQTLKCPAPDQASALGWLESAGHFANGQGADYWQCALALAGNAPLRALAMHETGLIAARNGWARDLTGLMQGQKSVVTVAADWLNTPAADLLDWLGHWCADILKVRYRAKAAQLRNPDLAEMAAKQGAELESISLTRYLRQLHQYRAALRGNANPTLMVEAALTLWSDRLRALQ